ncbi:MFS transporter [Aliifodinibius sp. S!AR15-10]|uniref:MFS transporter n=1 Tax=Aliifodinibius sp. S!AR15-10 TaxID=2950437 RepID=UPI0028613325|nr:MFS transporter [Aliifodinibius sp. S!AR15-10]MDR8390110.1 MFS transporter [Aliifodinibius sp. S!AR15-10]
MVQSKTVDEHRPLLKDKNLYVIFCVTLSAVMGVASIAPALPKMARVLNVSNEQIGLLITFFTVPGIFLTPVLGVLADRIGRKAILIPSLFIFGIAGTACAYAPNFTWLLVLRFLQGIGGASLGALNVTLIGDLYSGNRRATAMGYNASVLSVGTASYPAVGGALATLGWFFPFYLSLLAIPAGLYVLFSLRNPEPENGTELKEYFANIFGSIKSKKVIGLFAANFLTFVMLYGAYLTFFPILMDQRFGKSSFVIGIILSGSSFVTALTSSQLGKLAARFSEANLIVAAAVIYISVFLMIPFVGNIWLLMAPIALFGFAQGINIPSVLNLLTHQAPSEHRAAFLSVNWTVIRGGQALGPVLLGLVYGVSGITGTFLFTAGLAGIFVLIGLSLIKGRRIFTKN